MLAFLVTVGCTHASSTPVEPDDAVLYTIGASTDPYGDSAPAGFGVVTGLERGEPRKVEVREPRLGGFNGAEWLDGGLIVVPRPWPPLRPPLLFRYDGKLERHGTAPIPGGAAYAWSPHLGLFAFEPPVPCKRKQRSLFNCYRASGELFVTRDDGTDRRIVAKGHLLGWTADGRIAFFESYQRATPEALEPGTGATGPVLAGWKAPLPIWSPDRRLVAAVSGPGIVIAHAGGRLIQTIRSRLVISMIAWAPVGRRLAFTTSGFPDPHQLFVVDSPGAKPRLLYTAGFDHFDWFAWSPDGERILLDDDNRSRWLLFRTDRSGERRVLPRLGGRPLWCCPVNSYAAGGGGMVRNS